MSVMSHVPFLLLLLFSLSQLPPSDTQSTGAPPGSTTFPSGDVTDTSDDPGGIDIDDQDANETTTVFQTTTTTKPNENLNFWKQVLKCSNETYAGTDASEDEEMYYPNMCGNPMVFSSCMQISSEDAPIVRDYRTAVIVFCAEMNKDLKDLSTTQMQCLKNFRSYTEECLDHYEDEGNRYLRAFLAGEDVHAPELCGDGYSFFHCATQKLMKCDSSLEPYAFFYMAQLGGKCLASYNMLNPIVTMEMCSSAIINQATLTTILTICLIVYVARRM